MFRSTLVVLTLLCASTSTFAGELPVAGETFVATDSLAPGDESSADAKACLDGLLWQAAEFRLQCKAPRERCGDLMIQFPSPLPTGDPANDSVTLEWYIVRDEDRVPVAAPAVVVVHESGSGMSVGRMFARGLRLQGFHAFMIQLPYYGERRANGKRPSGENLVPVIRQAIADVRRARDAVAVLPFVNADNISLQGTSLGGFVCATAASLDKGYDQVFIVLAGGGLYDVIQNGEKDAAKFREELTKAGLTGDKLESLVATIEPTRIAHRLDPETTWLYSAQFDKVVPPANSQLLARTAKLDSSHHIEMLANHYTGIIYVPYLLTHMQQQIRPAEIEAIGE
ncbi:MAG: prolyl oligopeptidase family serine peptidase [Planctomycetes bacterium]|nr:prolyl oligopeptidase family serine peptidase [Planctomycetota bacterium]